MPDSRRIYTAIRLVSLLIAFTVTDAAAIDDEEVRIAEINRMIVERGYRWTAGKTSVSGLNDIEKKKLLGFVPPPEGWLDDLPPYSAAGQTVDDPVFDWRELGGVSPVKDQGSCGACWAFAAIGQLESHVMIYDGRTEDLSEQHVLDCNPMAFDCNGGWHWTALELLRDDGAVRESCYPYLAEDGHMCKPQLCRTVTRVEDLAPVHGTVNGIKQALIDGPVSSAISVPCELFYYTGGLFESSTHEDINHVIVIVGWDETNFDGEGAWICKNSWGSGWGEDGYFYVRYGDCNIGTYCYRIEFEPAVRLLSPKGGEILTAGRSYVITWSTGSETPDSFTISLSFDGGQTFDHTVTSGIHGVNSFRWDVPDIQRSTLRIKIEAFLAGELLGRDVSDDDFSIKIANFLDYNYPNPFNSTTTVPYAVDRPCAVTIAIFDLAGRLVTILERRRRDPGIFEAVWDGRDEAGRYVASGIYICRIEAGDFSSSCKIVYVK
jgi:C1A family cysteine protease